MNLYGVVIFRLNREFVIARWLVFADHFVELDDHRLDKIVHPGAFFNHFVLHVRDLVFANANVVQQSKRQVLCI